MQMILASKASSEERIPRVHVPVLVIMGSKDRDFKNPEAEAQWVAKSLNGNYEVIPEAGHYPHAEMPGRFTELVLDFLSTLRRKNQKAA